jgi:hypothetical protein
MVDWKENSGDPMKEIIYQSIWDKAFKEDKYEWKDALDKKNVLMYGLSTKMLNIADDGVDVTIMDVYDIVYDPLMSTENIETARYIIRQNIFKPLREILVDDRYDKKGRDDLKNYIFTQQGLVQSGENKTEFDKKMERLKAMGVNSSEFPTFSAGDTLINLCEHYTNLWNPKTEKFERRVIVYANDNFPLLDEKLVDLIGIEEWPFVVWSEDVETTDIYPDSVADLVRVPNKVMNMWFSQQAENRTLQNFQMHWYDATVQGYKPQTYTPGPGVMLPAPGDPNKTIMPVEINGLDETFNAINFLTQIVERGSGATAIMKGQAEQGAQTLGEVQIIQEAAQARSTAMTKFYRASWYELAKKWDKMMQANSPKRIKLYKTGKTGKVYEKIVSPSDWKSEAGYEPTVTSNSELETQQTKILQKFLFVTQQYPDNIPLRRISQKKQLEVLKLTPDELKQISDFETKLEKQQEQMAQAQNQQTQADAASKNAKAQEQGSTIEQPPPSGVPGEQDLMAQAQQQMQQLGQLTA